MPPVAEEIARTRSLAALTAAACEWPAEQIEAAEQLAEQIGRHASAVVDTGGHVPTCDDPECPLEHHPAGVAAVKLAAQLAAALNDAASRGKPAAAEVPGRNGHPNGAHPGSNGRSPNGRSPLRTAHERYVQSLREAAAVVYCCRRVLHTSDECFFDGDGPGSGLCGRVLSVSHRLERDVTLRR